jgi:ABC-type branched-subunit amino acid transport system ATPase component
MIRIIILSILYGIKHTIESDCLTSVTEGIQPNFVSEIRGHIKKLNEVCGLTELLVGKNFRLCATRYQNFTFLKRRNVTREDIKASHDKLIDTYLKV